jgi:hypothetical protein
VPPKIWWRRRSSVIADQLAELTQRFVAASGVRGRSRRLLSAAVSAWLTFVRALCVQWLTDQAFSRAELHELCVGALRGAIGSVVDLDRRPVLKAAP